MSVSSAEDVYLRLLWRICLQLQYELSKGLIEWRHRTGNELIAVQMPYELSNRLTTLKKTRHVTHLPDSSPENLSNIHDSSGLAVVLHLHRTCARIGCDFRVRGTPPQPMRVFDAAGLPQVIVFERGE